METLVGQHAFITGGASGIGLALAQALLAEGAVVTVADCDAERLAALPRGLSGVALDVREREGWATAKTLAEAHAGPVAILVNNAGIGPDGKDLVDMAAESFDRMIGIDLVGVFNGIAAFGAGMRARRTGHIVNTASVAGLLPMRHLGAYVTAKFGVIGLSEVLRAEMAPHGVGVSVLCPGLIATNLRESTLRAGSEVPDGASSAGMNAIDPERVAARVVAGIKGNWRYILTHGEDRDHVAARMDSVMAAFAETPPSHLL